MADQGGKPTLRKILLATIAELGEADRSSASERIRSVLIESEEFRSAGCIAGFHPLASEPDLRALFWDITGGHRRPWCFPRIDGDRLEMREVQSEDRLVEGRFGTREPDLEFCPLRRVEDLGLILVPGVGFDPATGARLGRGGGHYDRFLEGIRQRTNPPPIWGVCFSVQMGPVPTEPHDQPVDAILSESGLRGM